MPPRPGSARKGGGKKKKEGKPPTADQDIQEAAPALEVTPEAKAAAQAHKATGNTAFAAGNYKEAIAAFSKAIESDPTDHVFFSNRSASYASLENFKAAISDAERCVSLNPAWSKGYSRLGVAKFKAGDLVGARAAYKAGLKVDKGSQALADGLHEVEVAAKAAQKAQGQEVSRLAEELAGGAKVGGGGAGGGDNKPVEHVIGIDLGTTFSCVAVWRNGEPEVLTNSEGERTTPSWVAFTEQGRVVGAPAKRQAAMNTKNTLFNIKRIIGRQFSECYDEVKRMPFEVEEGPGGKPVVKVDVDGKRKTFAPEQVSAMVLEKMKATAEMALGCKVSKAVVTVPAYFNDAQRRLTKDAGAIAGLEVLRIINEPTAAALAYGLDKGGKDSASKNSQTILVFDLGGGTFDVSLLKIEGGMFEVLATSGDTHLGGEDFDSVLADWVATQVRKKKGKDLFTGDDRAMRKLRTACEQAKRQLSSSMTTRVELYMGDEEISVEVTRALFEKLCEQTFQRCLEAVKRCLADAKLKREDVDEIVLVGGSTRVPRVQAILSEHFGGRTLCKSVHPDEAVAFGAAVQGAILAGVRDASTQDLLLVDVTPLSLGVECEGNHFSRVVMRNTSIPCKCTSEFTTVEDYQTEVDIRIFEGERQNTDGNHLLGEFQIKGIERAKRGEAKVEVTFEVSTNGLLNVYARDKMTGAKADVSIQHDRGRLTSDDIERMVAEAEAMRQEDEDREREALGAEYE